MTLISFSILDVTFNKSFFVTQSSHESLIKVNLSIKAFIFPFEAEGREKSLRRKSAFFINLLHQVERLINFRHNFARKTSMIRVGEKLSAKFFISFSIFLAVSFFYALFFFSSTRWEGEARKCFLLT